LKSKIGAVPLDDQRPLRPAAESQKFGMTESFDPDPTLRVYGPRQVDLPPLEEAEVWLDREL